MRRSTEIKRKNGDRREQNAPLSEREAINGGIIMQDTLATLKTRRSCRAYKPELIEEEKLNAILEAGTYAATGMGKQSPIIIAVTDRAMRDRLSKMNAGILGADIDPFYGAPELLIVLADKAVPTYLYDGALVMGNLMNAAAALGVGSC